MSALAQTNSRRFVLRRADDESGVSGTGVVAEGCEFANGACALSWLTPATSVGVYPNIKELARIHGHGGKTVVEWVDLDLAGQQRATMIEVLEMAAGDREIPDMHFGVADMAKWAIKVARSTGGARE